MTEYRTVLFDLDGTITDSGTGIMNAIRYAVRKRGLEEPEEAVLRSFIGPPLKEQFRKVFHLPEAEGSRMVALYREYYGEKGIFENRVYDGVPEMLDMLKRDGIRILMATSKPENYARIIAEHFDFARYFDFIGGACMDGTRTAKGEVIEYVLKTCGISEEERNFAVMIGDRSHDIVGAMKCGLHSIGVLYGYGSIEELESAGAERIAETPEMTAELIIRSK